MKEIAPGVTVLDSPTTNATLGAKDAIKEYFDFKNTEFGDWAKDPKIASEAALKLTRANLTENNVLRTAETAPTTPGQQRIQSAQDVVDSFRDRYVPAPKVDQAALDAAMAQMQTAAPVQKQVNFGNMDPNQRNFILGASLGNLFNGNGFGGAVDMANAGLTQQQQLANEQYARDIAAVNDTRQMGGLAYKAVMDKYKTDTDFINDQNAIIQRQEGKAIDSRDRITKEVERNELRKLEIDERARVANQRYELGMASNKTRAMGTLFDAYNEADGAIAPLIAMQINAEFGMNLPTDGSFLTVKQKQEIAKLKQLEGTVKLIAAKTRLTGAQTDMLRERIRNYPEEMRLKAAALASIVQFRNESMGLDRERYNNDVRTSRDELRAAGQKERVDRFKTDYEDAEKVVSDLRDQIEAAEKRPNKTKTQKEDIAKMREDLAVAETRVTNARKVYYKESKELDDLINAIAPLDEGSGDEDWMTGNIGDGSGTPVAGDNPANKPGTKSATKEQPKTVTFKLSTGESYTMPWTLERMPTQKEMADFVAKEKAKKKAKPASPDDKPFKDGKVKPVSPAGLPKNPIPPKKTKS
jgi:hypothetical protein